MTKRPFAERSRSEHKTAGPIFHSLKIYFQKESFMTENIKRTKSWDELTFADNFLWLNHRFRRDSLKTHLVSFTGFAVAPYLQNT